MSPKIKNTIIIAVAGVVLIAAYFLFLRPGPEEASLEPVGNPLLPAGAPLSSGTLNSGDFLSLLLNVKNIKLDDAIFNKPAFLSLSDSSITLTPDGTEGRPNPFAPFGAAVEPGAED